MEKYIILPDAACDLNSEVRGFFGLEDYVKCHASVSDGREITATLDWSNISMREFYDLLGDKRIKVTTSPANAEEFYNVFESYAKQGIAVLSMSLSSTISATHSFASTAKERLLKDYPDARIYCLDTYRMSGAFGVLVMHALELQKQGKTFEEVIEWLEANKRCVHQMGPIDDLMVVARRGRITMGKAIMGSFAGVKPMGDCSADGYVTVIGKAKGIKKALAATAKYIAATIVHPEEQYVLVSHTDREEYAQMLKELIIKEVPVKGVFVSEVFHCCAPNIGPGMIAAYYLGREITGDLNEEKAVLASILGK